MFGKNKKVPVAILSCFLIAFIIQGILKICGVFVFEKALDWDIFRVIDSTRWLQIIYYSIINSITAYCLTFALNNKPYGNKWYHYIILVCSTFLITTCRMLIKTPFYMEFVYDVLLYIIVPTIINYITDIKNVSTRNIILLLSIHVLLYFVYLGLSYWSNLLSSLIPITQTALAASASFLIRFETYIGLILLMLSMNI